MPDDPQMCMKRFLEERSPESFMAFRRAVAAQPGYSPYAHDPQQAAALLEQKKFVEARDFILSVMRKWMLNPGMHIMAHCAYKALGMQHEADMEGMLAALMMEGILSTGDGTEQRPYRVLYVMDEYDVLQRFGKKARLQSLATGPDGPCDVQECEDGSAIWFDISVPISQLNRSPEVSKKWWEFWK